MVVRTHFDELEIHYQALAFDKDGTLIEPGQSIQFIRQLFRSHVFKFDYLSIRGDRGFIYSLIRSIEVMRGILFFSIFLLNIETRGRKAHAIRSAQ